MAARPNKIRSVMSVILNSLGSVVTTRFNSLGSGMTVRPKTLKILFLYLIFFYIKKKDIDPLYMKRGAIY
jgi:hypothetical protein